MSRREDELLRAAFEESHRQAIDEAPAFAELLSRARGAAATRRPGRTLGWALAAVSVCAVLVVWAAGERSARRTARALRQAEASALDSALVMASWQAPLDFLLETPGRRWLESTPSWSSQLIPEGGLSTPIEELHDDS